MSGSEFSLSPFKCWFSKMNSYNFTYYIVFCHLLPYEELEDERQRTSFLFNDIIRKKSKHRTLRAVG